MWDQLCSNDQFVRIHESFWNSPEGCVSVIEDYAGKGSLQNLANSIGSLPEATLQHLARFVLRNLDYLHGKGVAHSNITNS